MKINEAPEKVNTDLSDPETGVRPGHGTDWGGLAWLTILVAVSLIVFERLKHLLFPGLTSAENQGVTVCVGTIAAVVGTYYVTRRLDRVISMHAQVEKKLALERNVLRTVTDNIPDSIFAKDTEGRYLLTNKAFATLHGAKSPGTFLRTTAFDLFPKARAVVLHEDDLQVMRTRGAATESQR